LLEADPEGSKQAQASARLSLVVRSFIRSSVHVIVAAGLGSRIISCCHRHHCHHLIIIAVVIVIIKNKTLTRRMAESCCLFDGKQAAGHHTCGCLLGHTPQYQPVPVVLPVPAIRRLAAPATTITSRNADRLLLTLLPSQEVQNVQYQVALLVHLAKETNRTLVLPQHLRERNGGTFPVYSLVDVSSIESIMGVPWRFLSIEESRQLEDRTTVLEIMEASGSSSGRSSSSVLPDLLQQTRDCDTAVCAFHGIYKVSSSSSYYSELADIVSNLTWCLEKYTHKHPEIPFGSQIGGYDRLCSK
jgi:hypothetical protein